MAYLIVRHPVKDYNSWKSGFDAALPMRKAAGEKSYRLLHREDDTNDLVVFFEWDSLDNAHKFMESAELKQAMQKAGVDGEPEFHFLHEVTRGTI